MLTGSVRIRGALFASVAQLVEQGFCKALAAGSNPVGGLPTMGTLYKEHDYTNSFTSQT